MERSRRCAACVTGVLAVVAGTWVFSEDVGRRRAAGRLSVLAAPVEVARLTAPRPGPSHELGRSVAVGAGVIVVGAPGNVVDPQHHAAGAAHVFVFDGHGWRHRQRLVAFDREHGDSFGRAVVVSGDTIAVGAEHDNHGAVVNAGSVYVYVRSGRIWSLERKLVAPDPRTEAHFGHSLALEGDTLVVGTWGTNAVYAFERTGSWWSEPQVIRALPEQVGNFGHSLALDGDTLVVGAEWRYQPDAEAAAGGASVYDRVGGGWELQQDLVASDARENDHFGASVAVDGGTIVVGAPDVDDELFESSGAVYVYRQQQGSWVETQKLVSCEPRPWVCFGWAVGLAGRNLLVGSPWEAVGDQGQAGCVHAFRKSGGSWNPSCVLTASDASSWSLLGEVALAGHTAVLGARLADVEGQVDAGEAYVVLIP